MPERKDTIGATHEFHNRAYAHWWAERFAITSERLECFMHIGDLAETTPPKDRSFLELGTGPGFLAHYLLGRFPLVRYHCVDYSDAMLTIAKEKLGVFGARVTYQQIDLCDTSWHQNVERGWSAIVSTWALHDLNSEKSISLVYKACASLLRKGGILINADFIKPDDVSLPFEPGRILVSSHLNHLKEAGFKEVACTNAFEMNSASPASHNNYACLKGQI